MLFENAALDMIAWAAGFVAFMLAWQWIADRTWAKPHTEDRPPPPAE